MDKGKHRLDPAQRKKLLIGGGAALGLLVVLLLVHKSSSAGSTANNDQTGTGANTGDAAGSLPTFADPTNYGGGGSTSSPVLFDPTPGSSANDAGLSTQDLSGAGVTTPATLAPTGDITTGAGGDISAPAPGLISAGPLKGSKAKGLTGPTDPFKQTALAVKPSGIKQQAGNAAKNLQGRASAGKQLPLQAGHAGLTSGGKKVTNARGSIKNSPTARFDRAVVTAALASPKASSPHVGAAAAASSKKAAAKTPAPAAAPAKASSKLLAAIGAPKITLPSVVVRSGAGAPKVTAPAVSRPVTPAPAIKNKQPVGKPAKR